MSLFHRTAAAYRTKRSRRPRHLGLEGLESRMMLAAGFGQHIGPVADSQPSAPDALEVVDTTPLTDWHLNESFLFNESVVESLETVLNAALQSQGGTLQDVSFATSGTYSTSYSILLQTLDIELDYQIGANIQLSDLAIDDVEFTMIPGDAQVPYYLQLRASLNDIAFDTDVDVDIFVETGDGVNIDTQVSGALTDLQFTLTIAPPREGINEFSLDAAMADATLDMSYASDVDITLAPQTQASLAFLLGSTPMLAWLGPPQCYGVAAAIIDNVTSDLEDQLESALTGEIDDQLHIDVEDQLIAFGTTAKQIDGALELMDFTFWSLAATQTQCVTSPDDSESLDIVHVSYMPGTGAYYWITPAVDDSTSIVAILAAEQPVGRSFFGTRPAARLHTLDAVETRLKDPHLWDRGLDALLNDLPIDRAGKARASVDLLLRQVSHVGRLRAGGFDATSDWTRV